MWYTSWFNSPYYHMLYRNRDEREAADFVDHSLKYLKPDPAQWILDQGCGRGRHSIHMNRQGYKVIGIDISMKNISYAKTFENEGLKFEIHDMREPYPAINFGLVMSLFTSFGYFDSLNENLKVLNASYQNLRPKGRLLIDYFNVGLLRQNLVERETQVIEDVEFHITRQIENEMVVKRIKVLHGKDEHHFEERVMTFDKQDFAGMLSQVGFEVLDVFGNYSLGQFRESSSPRLITLARKSS